MIKQILKQIWSQRGKNSWIYLELLIVFVLLWYIFDYGFMMIHNRLIPRGFDIENTYRVYCDDIKSDEDKIKLEIFKKKVEQFPGIEYVLLSDKYDGVTPFNGSYSAKGISNDTTSNAISISAQRKAITSPNYFKIFHVRSVVHQGSLANLDFSNTSSIVLTENLAKLLFGEEDPIGKSVFLGEEDEYIVTDVVEDQKRYDYVTPHTIFFIPRSESEVTMPELAIRVNETFSLDDFKNEVSKNIVSYYDVKTNIENVMGTKMDMQLRIFVMLFFVLSTALGVIGTFWFRNQARRNEIGVRMSMGSSRKEVLRQFVTEAILLLTLAAIPAMVVIAVILHLDIIEVIGLSNIDNGHYIIEKVWLRGLITVVITYILMAVIVGVSAWIPARRAARVNPVEALRDE